MKPKNTQQTRNRDQDLNNRKMFHDHELEDNIVVNSSHIIYRFNHFANINKLIWHIKWESKRLNNQHNTEEQSWRTLPYLKIYYKAYYQDNAVKKDGKSVDLGWGNEV